MIEHLKQQSSLHATALERRVTALRHAVSDLMGLGVLPDWELQLLHGYLPYMAETEVRRRFAEMRSFLIDMSRCDKSEPAYRHAKDRFEDLAVDAVAADEKAAGR